MNSTKPTVVSRPSPIGQGLLLSVALIMGCVKPDQLAAPSGDSHTFFQTLYVQEHAVNLTTAAPYDTVQLHVVARFGDGQAIPDQVQYTPSDSTITVDPSGLVHAHFVTTDDASIGVSVTYGGLTRHDVVYVRVRDTATHVTGVAIQLPNGAPSRIPIVDTFATRGALALTAGALGTGNVPAPDVVVKLESSDTVVATVDQTGLVTAVSPGRTVVRVSTVANGRRWVDSLALTVGLPQVSGFDVGSPVNPFHPTPTWILSGSDTARITRGGIVTWTNNSTTLARVTFENPAQVDSAPSVFGAYSGRGDIANFGAGNMKPLDDYIAYVNATQKARRFPVSGTYRFTLTPADPKVTPVHGVVLVCDEDAGPCPFTF